MVKMSYNCSKRPSLQSAILNSLTKIAQRLTPDEKWTGQEEKLNELAAHREEFYAVLERWLEGVRERAFKPE